MTERRNPGRPRKWASDAERMRARRAAQRADREKYAEAGRAKVLGGSTPTDPVEAARRAAALPNAEGVEDLEQLVELLMIACQVEGGIHEWLHQSCLEDHSRVLAALIAEQEFAREVMAEAKALDHTNRLLRERLTEVDPNGPFRLARYVSSIHPELLDKRS